MALKPILQQFKQQLEQQASEGAVKSPSEMTIEEWREDGKAFLDFAGDWADVARREFSIKARDGYEIPVIEFDPGCEPDQPFVVFYKGCGYVHTLFEVNARAASRIAKLGQVKVFAVDYRLAPEHPLPTSIDDGYDAAKYLYQHASDFQVDAERLIVAGISSGAHCAASVSLRARNAVDFNVYHQILLNGCFDFTCSQTAFKDEAALEFMCTDEVVDEIYRYLRMDGPDLSAPEYSLVFADTHGAPNTTMLIAEHDILRPDNEAFCRKLQQDGNQVERIVLEGQTHNDLIIRGVLTDADDPAHVLADVIKRC